MCDISIILVNYNGKRYIDALFESLCALRHDGFDFEVVFVDNASTDGSAAYLKVKQYPLSLKIVESGENLGFAGGNNLGVKHAEGEYIVLLNNDTRVEEDWLTNLYRFMREHPDAAMVNSKLLFFYDFLTVTFETSDKILMDKQIRINGREYTVDNKFCTNLLYEPERNVCFGHSQIHIPLIDGVREYRVAVSFQEPLNPEESIFVGNCKVCGDGSKTYTVTVPEEVVKAEAYALVQNAGSGVNETFDGYDIGFCQRDGEAYGKAYEINNGCGAAIMMKRRHFDDCGMFDERFFMYYEDTDLSYRMKKYGKIYFCPTAVVRHIHTGSSTEWSPFFTYQVYRNKLLFVYKNISRKEFRKYYKIHRAQGEAENNPYKIRGAEDAKKIIRGKKGIHF